jgi:hypothetical protein
MITWASWTSSVFRLFEDPHRTGKHPRRGLGTVSKATFSPCGLAFSSTLRNKRGVQIVKDLFKSGCQRVCMVNGGDNQWGENGEMIR